MPDVRLIDANAAKEKLGFAIEPLVVTGADIIRNDTLLDAIKIVDSMPTVNAHPMRHGKWVSCEETMPATNRNVLVLCNDNLNNKTFCGVAFWGRSIKRNGQFTWMFPAMPMQYDFWLIPEWAQCEVTHWMPLPDPPKEP